MKMVSTLRAAAAAALSLLLIVPAGPAAAATISLDCYAVPGGPVPYVYADIDEDGDPDVQSPQPPSATVCLGSDVFLAQPVRIIQCAPNLLTCGIVLVTVGFSGTVDTSVSVCHEVGAPSCTTIDPPPVSVAQEPRTICFGWDLNGIPCPPS